MQKQFLSLASIGSPEPDTISILMNTEVSAWMDSLNPKQQEAVGAPFGNLLVLAGAGSGKTRVLVHRIAWLISEQQVSAHGILAVTFTNKAAGEMRSRLHQMLGMEAEGMWVGTFHGLSHRLLRLHYEQAGLPQTFQVLDSDDQLQLIRRIFKTLQINEDRFEPKKVQGYINRKKDEGIRAKSLPPVEGSYDRILQEIYCEYEKICKDNGVVDFSELLLLTYETLKENEELLTHYQARFKHFLVDEFQDTNTIQYRWLSLLAKKAQSVTVVGDDDQSIYGWRGAKVENIYRFEKDHKGTQVVRLEQNYRSTNTILSAANSLISNNDNRFGKTLWTEGSEGERISLYSAFNEEDEALYVVREIRKWLEQGIHYNDIGILYRSNAQSRVLEEAFVRAGLPYTIYGGMRFFERAEIKDALAYLRLASNTSDDTAFRRVINVPPRGFGEKSFQKIDELSQVVGCSHWDAAQKAIEDRLLSARAENSLRQFCEIIKRLQEQSKTESLPKLMETAVHDSGLIGYFNEQSDERSRNRAENLEELINAAGDFELEFSSEEEMSPLTAFLAYASLEAGEKAVKHNGESVQLMTLHSAKGLEFPVVFICGLEEGLFPHHFSKDSPKALEEERRLCYVGITRARQKLYLTYSEKRRVFGRDEDRFPSRFVREVPEHLLDQKHRKVAVHYPSLKRTPIPKSKGQTILGFQLGQQVRHPKFGEGTIIDLEGSDERARVHVQFGRSGSKWLALAFAKLEAI